MWIFNFYRFYCAILAGGLVYAFFIRSIWIWILSTIIVRVLWFAIERAIESARINASFQKHIPKFKEQFGPYGIRLANKAEKNSRIRKSLAEVFTDDPKKLKKSVEQLEVMDALFQAGMRPEGDEYLLHDLKLKYGKNRLEQQNK
ncbi:MAG: hypothetical protein GF401_01425 [Chitinivibrionales bacterium]|nr:hypothetical protein [Chitinivibrionales bacterium]